MRNKSVMQDEIYLLINLVPRLFLRGRILSFPEERAWVRGCLLMALINAGCVCCMVPVHLSMAPNVGCECVVWYQFASHVKMVSYEKEKLLNSY